MIQKKVMVTTNIEAKTAAFFVQKASEFESSIFVNLDNKTVNGKSMMGMVSLQITEGNELVILADGPDAEEAVNALSELFA